MCCRTCGNSDDVNVESFLKVEAVSRFEPLDNTVLQHTVSHYRSQSLVIFRSGSHSLVHYKGADKSLARPGRKQATATEDFDVHISYL